MKIKICGLNDVSNVRELINCQPDMMGFNFYPASPRYAGQKDFMDFLFQEDDLFRKNKVQKVGVTVNMDPYMVYNVIAHCQLDVIQLHGQESPAQCLEFRNVATVIKAIPIGDVFPTDLVKSYEGAVDYFLFDTKGIHPGGNGFSFSHSLLQSYTGKVPYLLAGGLGEEHASFSFPSLCVGLDFNSKLEIIPGFKDQDKVKRCIHLLRKEKEGRVLHLTN